jgi:hypothetical protein
MSKTLRMRSRQVAMLGLVAVSVLAACGSQLSTAPLETRVGSSLPPATGDASTTTGRDTSTTAPIGRHPGHDGLATALPRPEDLAWLPSDVVAADDSDLTSRLSIGNCAGNPTRLTSREESATNRGYDQAGQRLAEVTYYDVETPAGAHQFMAALDAYLQCAASAAPSLSFSIVDTGPVETTHCDEAVSVRARQPVSETVDEWCRVGNLLAWIRLYPTGEATGTGASAPGDTGLTPAQGENLTPPTDSNAVSTLTVVGQLLRVAYRSAA